MKKPSSHKKRFYKVLSRAIRKYEKAKFQNGKIMNMFSGYYFSSSLTNNEAWGAGNGYNVGRTQTLSKNNNHYLQCVRKAE